MRAAIFIDGGYFLQGLKPYNLELDYEKLTTYLTKPISTHISIDLLRIYFYYCAPWMSQTPTEDEQRRMKTFDEFVLKLERLNRWQFRYGKLEKRFQDGKEYFEQKRVDVLLSVDLVRHAAAGHIQHAILVAGDSDFIPAIIATKESGVTTTLWHRGEHAAHKDLVKLCDEVYPIDWNALLIRKKPLPRNKKRYNNNPNNPNNPNNSNPRGQDE